jgi:hypothetical protein
MEKPKKIFKKNNTRLFNITNHFLNINCLNAYWLVKKLLPFALAKAFTKKQESRPATFPEG